MSGNFDLENIHETSTAVENVDDHDDDVGVNSESTNNQELSSREANYDSNNSNEDGVMVNTDNNGSSGDSDGVVVSEDAGPDDMFLDAPEDLGADGRDSSATFTEAQGSTDGEDDGNRHQTRFGGLDNEMQNDYMVDEMERLRSMLDKTTTEKESIAREYKDKMEMAAKGIANLRDQMRNLINKQLLQDQRNSGPIDSFHGVSEAEQTPLHEMIHECSIFLKDVTEEIQDLNRKSTEVSVSREVVDSFLSSVQNESAEAQFQKDQHMEDITNRMLSSFASVVYVGDLLDSSIAGKIAHVEKCVFALIENYNWFLYQSDQLRQCLTEVRPDLAEQSDYGVIFAAANDELLGFKKKETDFVGKLSHLEVENSKVMEQLDKHKVVADTTSAELERLKAELEQEKHRYSNTKEKLSLAVTKGKALVQQRDSLKQTIADKTNELEKCLIDLKEKSTALEAAESMKEELVTSQILGASLQEMLVQKDLILENLEDILFQSGVLEGLKSEDVTAKIRWLVDERNALKDVSLKFHQLADALLSIDLPENFSFSDLESRLGWLTKSFDQAKSEIGTLQSELTRTRDSLYQAESAIGALQDENASIRKTAFDQMDHLTALLSIFLVEKDYVKMELEDMSHKFETIVQGEHQASSEKEQMLRILLEASGVTVVDKEPSETATLVEQCLAAMTERTSSSHESFEVNEEILQSLQMMLYVKNQELALHENLLEQEIQKEKTEMDKLFSDLRKASEEVATLKEEKETLKKDLERTEDKNALIREKLSMAVKKGKGLVQERENLKQLIDEKSSEIEKIKDELQQKELAISEYKNENNRLSSEVQGIAKLEEDLLGLKAQQAQLESNLLESNKLLQTLMESLSSIILPSDSSFDDPVEKLTWLAGYLSECQVAKEQTEQQLEKATVEVELLSTKVKSLEDALAVAEEKIYQLAEEKRELEIGRTSIQEQLQSAMEEANLFAETDAAKRSLENALAMAETKISMLNKEKEEAESSRAAAEAEVNKAREEFADLTGKLSEATTDVKKLEDTVSHLETRICALNDENNEAQISRANTEDELKKLKDEADTWNNKLQDAYSTIKSLEEALTKAENSVAELANDKNALEQEISTLSAKLNACMEELAGTHGSLESRSLQLFYHLKDLELLGKDETILTSVRKCCEMKFERLKEMEHLFKNIRDQFTEMIPENYPVSEEPSCFRKLLATNLDNIVGMDFVRSHADELEADDISLYVQKIVERFHVTNKSSAEKVDGFFAFLNECNGAVMQELLSISNWITPVVEKMNSQNQKIKNMETDFQALENKVTSLEDDVSVLLSVCNEATEVLEFEVDKRMPEINSTSEHEAAYEKKFHESKHAQVVEKLLSASRKVCIVCDLFEKSSNMHSSTTEELQSKLNEVKVTADKAMEETELYKNKVHELETEIAAQQNLCSELRVKLEYYQDIEVNLRDKEEEISSLQDTLMMKEREVHEALVQASYLENLLERVNRIQISGEDLQVGDLDPQDSTHIKKLFYAIDNFPQLQHQIKSLSHEKEELQTALAAQLRETEHLKEQVQDSNSHEQELAKVKSKVIEMEAGLDRIMQMFTSGDITGDQKSVSTNDLVRVLEKLVMTMILESENLKSRTHELESQIENSISNEEELAKIKSQLLDLERGAQRIIQNLGGDISGDQKHVATSDLVQVLEKLVMTVVLESEELKSKAEGLDQEVGTKISEQELARVKGQLFDIETNMQKIIQKLRSNVIGDQKVVVTSDLVKVLENMVTATIMESENSRSKVHELESKLLGSQKAVDELLLKVKALEDSLHSKAAPTEIVQERGIFEAPSPPSASEISEIEDVGSVSKPTISPVPSAAHVRTTWKGSSDHIALNVDSEASRLIDNEAAVKDKGLVFKSLNTSGLVPKQGKIVADRIDGIWVSSDRLLRSRPGARLGLIAYWLFLHIWLLGTIL